MQKKKNIPQLRFPEFSDEWETDVLENLTNRIGDGLHGTPEYTNISDIYFINGNNLINGVIQITDATKKVSLKTYVQKNRGLNENTILISINGTIGNIARYKNEKVMLGKSVGYFIFKERPDFYYYLLSTCKIQSFFTSELTGSTIKNLSLKTLRETEIFSPKTKEKNKIVSFLSAVDNKLQALKKKKGLLEQYKKGVMQKIFSQELRFKDENGKEFPKWVKKKLGDISEIKTGSKDTQDREENGLYPFFVRSNNVERINSYSFDGEAILTSGDGVGVGKNFHYINGKFDFHQRVYSIRKFAAGISGKFIFYYFLTYFFERVKRVSAKNSVDSVRMEMIAEMPIDLPSKEEQTKISNVLSILDEKINRTQSQIEKTEQFKKGLLQKMFI